MLCILFLAARDDLYGASRAVLAQLPVLQEEGFAPLLATPTAGPLYRAAAGLGFAVTMSRGLASQRSLAARLCGGLRLRPLEREARAHGVCLVVATTLSANPAAQRLATALEVPSVVHLRSQPKPDAFLRYRVPGADAVIAVSRAVESRYSDFAPSSQRRAVIFDGLPKAPLTLSREEARARLGLDPGARIVGMLGAIAPGKAPDFAARVVAQLSGVQLVLLGDGDSRYAQSICMNSQVRALGFRSDARALLPAFDVLVHPSRREAFGLAPLEAMAAGVPVLVSAIDGLPEAVGEGGQLLPPEDEQAWLQALAELLDDPAERARWSARGRAFAATRTAEVSARLTAAFYREVIGGSS